jgi:ribosomal protein L37AE/L43A
MVKRIGKFWACEECKLKYRKKDWLKSARLGVKNIKVVI